MSSTAWNGLAVLGLLFTLHTVFTLLRGLWTYFLRPGKDLHRLGSWAIVTGATDGIGRALAEALAKKGLSRPARLSVSQESSCTACTEQRIAPCRVEPGARVQNGVQVSCYCQ